MPDPFAEYARSQDGTGFDLVSITPNDGANLDTFARAIRCRPDGAGGTLRITSGNGAVRNTIIEAGETIYVRVIRVHAAGTAATGLEALI